MGTLKSFLATQEYLLAREHDAWNMLADKIRKNPNQMNVMGIWQQEQIQTLNILYCKIHCRENFIQDLKQHIGAKKPRKRLR